jgi:ATP diphosphatase
MALPALSRALKLQDKAATVGFDWPSLAPVFEKVREEIGELEEAVQAPASDDKEQRRQRVADELGDLLFVLANVARHLDIDAETALRGTNAKFVRRFAAIEARLAETGRTLAESDLAEMDRLWNEAKANERKG